MGLDELLKALMGGASAGQQRSTEDASSGDPLADMLAGILGGGTTSSQQSGGLEDILGGILGGAAGSGSPTPQGTSGGGGMEDILGGILGGAAGSGSPTPQGTSGGGLMDIISAVLGGGQAQQQATPIIEGVAGKTGMSQIIVQMILSFVMSKLLSGAAGGASGMGGLFPGMESDSASVPGQQAKQGLDLDSLLEQMGQDSGVANELAQKTGLDKGTAQQGLQEVLEALNAQRRGQSSTPSQPKQAGLDELLKDW